jgi:hypothetical protein
MVTIVIYKSSHGRHKGRNGHHSLSAIEFALACIAKPHGNANYRTNIKDSASDAPTLQLIQVAIAALKAKEPATTEKRRTDAQRTALQRSSHRRTLQ